MARGVAGELSIHQAVLSQLGCLIYAMAGVSDAKPGSSKTASFRKARAGQPEMYYIRGAAKIALCIAAFKFIEVLIAPPMNDEPRWLVAAVLTFNHWSAGLSLGLIARLARSGAAVVIPLPFGQHALTMRVWLRELETTALINALPGTDTDLVVRVSGGKSRRYSVTRQDLAVALADRRIVLSGPPEPTGS